MFQSILIMEFMFTKIKVEEAMIVYGPKMERVSITLMNCVLDSTFSGMSNKELKEDPQYFSVQSEREVAECKFPGA